MDFLIVTGMSGAGKSRAVDALEDIGFYCVDNMPPKLILEMAELCQKEGSAFERLAVVTDMRGGDLFYGLFDELDKLEEAGFCYKLLFLDASDQELMNRYRETRRRHPLVSPNRGGLQEAISSERILLGSARARADYIIDTTHLSANLLRQRLTDIFLDNIEDSMLITVMSFGFKHGLPAEADLVFDVRCLRNPFHVPELRPRTGLEQEVQDYVMDAPESKELLAKLCDLMQFVVPLYKKEGKTQLTIGVGCTGGVHRSVTIAEKLYKTLSDGRNNVRIVHRDIIK